MSLTGSLTIFLVIKLAIECQVSAFALRPTHSTETIVDLENEPSNLEVKNGLVRDVKGTDTKSTAVPQGIVPIETTAKTEDIQKNLNISNPVNSTTSSVPVTDRIPQVTIQQSLQTDTQPPTPTNPRDIQRSVSVTKGPNVINYNRFKPISSLHISEPTQVTQNENTSMYSTPNDVILSNTTNNITTNVSKIQGESSTTLKPPIVMSTNNEIIHLTTVKDNPATSTQTTEMKVEIGEDNTSVRNNDKESSSQHATSTSLPQSTSTSTESVSDTTTTEYESEKATVSNKLSNAETSPGEYTTEDVSPHGKKYTTIERKRTPVVTENEQSTSTDSDMARAHSAQTGILEQVLNNAADIPSLEKLKSEFLSMKSTAPYSTAKNALSSLITDPSTVTFSILEPSDIFTTDKSTSIEMIKNIITSQRAGFIDHSSKTTIPPETTEVRADPTTTEKAFTITQSTAGKVNVKVSQSQLAEDALNEELMKEQILNDNIGYTNRYNESPKNYTSDKNNNITNIAQTRPDILETTTQDSITEDTLSVKPITKSSGLYTVNPNYKPLKKLDVQPSKPFMRNPDDNSWRNESLSSQGIVFKANNSSKPFTEVLKNKTETELNSITDKESSKETAQELRERLEKIAEIRKSKKKKFGSAMYSEYDDINASAETITTQKPSPSYIISTSTVSLNVKPRITPTIGTTNGEIKTIKLSDIVEATTPTSSKINSGENFDGDDDDSDYITLPDIDIKKYITPMKTSKVPPFPSTKTAPPQPSQVPQFPERKPTIQYFPPRQHQKVNFNDYDDGFKSKINSFISQEPKIVTNAYTTPASQTEIIKYDQVKINNYVPGSPINHNLEKNRYNIQNGANTEFGANADRGSYIIKHLRDFINEASKGNDDRNAPYFMTDIPVRGVTVHADLIHPNKIKQNDYDEYENEFRKDVLVKFVQNFNENSDRFKVDFPILYNTSIIHNKENAQVASSRAYLKRVYEDANKLRSSGVKYDPNCERTVELSPEYELHYYVPDQEEKEVMEPKTSGPPFRYRIQG